MLTRGCRRSAASEPSSLVPAQLACWRFSRAAAGLQSAVAGGGAAAALLGSCEGSKRCTRCGIRGATAGPQQHAAVAGDQWQRAPLAGWRQSGELPGACAPAAGGPAPPWQPRLTAGALHSAQGAQPARLRALAGVASLAAPAVHLLPQRSDGQPAQQPGPPQPAPHPGVVVRECAGRSAEHGAEPAGAAHAVHCAVGRGEPASGGAAASLQPSP